MTESPEKADSIPEFEGDDGDKAVLRFTYGARQESYTAKRDRMALNRQNYDTYNLKGDFSHKKAGQSTEFLPKQMMATEQIASFMHQALVDVGNWFKIDLQPGLKTSKITPGEMTLILNNQLGKTKFDEVVEDALKMGLLGSLMIAKVHGRFVEKPTYYTERKVRGDGTAYDELYRAQKKVWELKVDLIRQEDWFPDPTGDALYEIQQIEMDLHKVQELAKGDHAIYDQAVVDQIVAGFEDTEQVAKKARETAQNQTFYNLRKRVRLWECYGNIIDPTSGNLLYENVTWTVANDRYLIRKPTKAPFWHGKSPFVVCPIIRLPKSVWHKALMDAPTALNLALNELFNLQLDTGIMATWGIRQLRTSWLADETKYSDGIAPGETIEVNDSCPPGAKVLEPVQTAEMSPEAAQTFNQTSAEFNQAALTNDLRMGVLPNKQIKATEVVEASQTITSMFTGIAKVIEQEFILGILAKAWPTAAQHMAQIDREEIKSLIGEQRTNEILSMSNEQIFKETAQGLKYKVYGISLTLNKMKDFKKITSLLQTIGTSEVLIEEFTKKYDFGKLLTEIMRSLDIDVERLEVAPEEAAAMGAAQQDGGQQPNGPGATPLGSQPNMQSNIAPVANMKEGPPTASTVPHAKFPPSRATPRGGM